MGGAASTIARVTEGVLTGGASELIPKNTVVGKALGAFNAAQPVNVAARSVAGFQTLANAPRDAANMMAQQQREQQAQAAAAEQRLLQQPRQIAPDNFLSTKNKMLQNMRLGLFASLPGSGGAPPPVLSAPSLTGNGPGKVKLGS